MCEVKKIKSLSLRTALIFLITMATSASPATPTAAGSASGFAVPLARSASGSRPAIVSIFGSANQTAKASLAPPATSPATTAKEAHKATPKTSAASAPKSQEKAKREKHTGVELPLTRVRGYVKEVVGTQLVQQEALVAVARAAELFVEHFAQAALASKADAHRDKRGLAYADLAECVKTTDNLGFLEDIIPAQVSYGSVRASLAAPAKAVSAAPAAASAASAAPAVEAMEADDGDDGI